MGPAETLPSSLTRGRIATWLALSLLVLAILIHLVLPFWALRWAQIPFSGFVVEQTLVVNDAHSADWPDKNAPASFSRIRAVDGQSVDTVAAFFEQLQNHAAGDEVESSWETSNSRSLLFAVYHRQNSRFRGKLESFYGRIHYKNHRDMEFAGYFDEKHTEILGVSTKVSMLSAHP